MRVFKKGTRVSFKMGLETRVTGTVDSGPHEWSAADRQFSKLNGLNFGRFYYKVRKGRAVIRCGLRGLKAA